MAVMSQECDRLFQSRKRDSLGCEFRSSDQEKVIAFRFSPASGIHWAARQVVKGQLEPTLVSVPQAGFIGLRVLICVNAAISLFCFSPASGIHWAASNPCLPHLIPELQVSVPQAGFIGLRERSLRCPPRAVSGMVFGRPPKRCQFQPSTAADFQFL